MAEEVLIDLGLDEIYDELVKVDKEVNRYKKSIKDLTDDIKAGKDVNGELSRSLQEKKINLKVLTATAKEYEKQILNEIKANDANEGSLVQLRLQLANITKAYDSLSESERESARGEALLKSLNEKTAALNEAEEASGRFQRSVGNYKNKIKEAYEELKKNQVVVKDEIKLLEESQKAQKKGTDEYKITAVAISQKTKELEKVNIELAEYEDVTDSTAQGTKLLGSSLSRINPVFGQLVSGSEGAGKAFTSMKTQAISLGKAFLTPPIGVIVLVLGAIMLAVKKVSDAFKKNDEAGTRLSKAFAVFQPIVTAVSKGFDALALGISKLIEGFANGFAAVLKFAEALKLLPKGFTDSAKEAQNLEQAIDDLQQAERDFTVNSAERNAEIAKLRDEATDKEKLTAKEREDRLNKAIDLEKQNLEEGKKIIAEKLRILEEKAKQEVNTSDETTDQIAQARAALFKADEEYYKGTMRLNREIQTFKKEQQREDIEANNKRIEKHKKLAENSLKIQQQLQDAILLNTKKGVELQIEQEKRATERQIEELKKQTDLTVQGKKDRDALIIELQKQSDAKIAEIQKTATAETIKKEFENEQKRLDILINAQVEGSREELRLRLDALEKKKNFELKAEGLTEQEKLLIQADYRQQAAEAERVFEETRQQAELNVLRVNLENKLSVARAGGEAELALKIEQLEMQRAAEITAAEKTGADISLINAKYNKLKTDITQQNNDAQISSIGDMLGNASALFEKGSAAYKVTATNQAIIDTYKSANAAYASLAGIPVVGPGLGIAAAGIAVAAGLKNVREINKTKDVKAPKFAGGGAFMGNSIVPGTQYVGDKVPAWVSSGEGYLNRIQLKNLYGIINNGVPVAGTDYTKLAEAMANFSPIVSVSEIKDVSSRVDVLENLGNY